MAKISQEERNSCKMVTPEFRVFYPHLFKAHAFKDSKPKFSVTMAFPKNSNLVGEAPDGGLVSLKEIILNAKIAKWGADKAEWPEEMMSPVTDGDKPKYAKREGYAGHWIVKASTGEDNRPGIYDERVKPIIDPAQVYPGCYAIAAVYAFAWEYMGKAGVSLILDHLQKVRDGKPLGGKKPGEQVFKPIAGARGASSPQDLSSDEDDLEY